MLRHMKLKTSADEMSRISESISLGGQQAPDAPSKISLNMTNASLESSSISTSSSEENASLPHIKPATCTDTGSAINNKKRKLPPTELEHTIPSSISFTTTFDKSHVAKKQRSAPVAKETSSSPLLLSEPNDADHLNPLHCFVRRNIEYFVATIRDVDSPCPGRKSAIRVGQIGLRCIHCRDVTDRRERTKRAVCYPSKVSRVYHCVSDMKFDHFSLCKFLPEEERKNFNDLKAISANKKRGPNARGGSNTAQYYLTSALKMGLKDSNDGVVVFGNQVSPSNSNLDTTVPASRKPLPTIPAPSSEEVVQVTEASKQPMLTPLLPISPRPDRLIHPLRTVSPTKSQKNDYDDDNSNQSYSPTIVLPDCRPLATPGDASSLNPIHRFVRQNVEVFIANEDDVAAPAPGRKTRVALGQVGIRCKHCKSLKSKERVKRAICYPPTIASLYHAVSNMKFDHYGACKGLPPASRERFDRLRASASASGGRKRCGSNSTAGYYMKSAILELGLVDTDSGIRVKNNSFVTAPRPLPLPPPLPVPSPLVRTSTGTKDTPIDASASTSTSDVSNASMPRDSPTMDGMSALMIAATDPAIRQDYENRKMAASLAGYRQEFSRRWPAPQIKRTVQ